MKVYDEVEFLNEVLKIASVNGVDDERNVARFLCEYLKEAGVDAALQEIDSRHANVIAVYPGKTEDKVVWNGHLDTVPYGKMAEWSSDPAVPVKKNGCIYARGASDMKSGLAGMVYTLAKMKRQGYVPKYTIHFFGTCDEEKGGLGARRILQEYSLEESRLVLVGEPTGCMLGTAQKGCIWVKMFLYGKTSHGAYPWEGVNAIETGFAIFEKVKEKVESHEHPLLGRATAQITMANGGIVPNMTPDEASMTIDIRVVPGLQSPQVLRWFEEAAQEYRAQSGDRFRARFHLENDRRAIEMDSADPWLKQFAWETECEGFCPEKIGINYFTDASILTKDLPEIPVLLFGPGEPQLAHKPDEYVEIMKYQKYIRILSRLF